VTQKGHQLRLALSYLQAIDNENFEVLEELWGHALESQQLAEIFHGLNAEIVAELDSSSKRESV